MTSKLGGLRRPCACITSHFHRLGIWERLGCTIPLEIFREVAVQLLAWAAGVGGLDWAGGPSAAALAAGKLVRVAAGGLGSLACGPLRRTAFVSSQHGPWLLPEQVTPESKTQLQHLL